MAINKWICSHCGQENDENFCIQCGSMRNPDEESLGWFCPKCGKKNNDLFCDKCGTKKPIYIDLEDNKDNGDEHNVRTQATTAKVYENGSDKSDENPVAPVTTVANEKHEAEAKDRNENITNNEDNTVNSGWVCPECGRRNDELFCEKCGTRKPSSQNLDKTIRVESKIKKQDDTSIVQQHESKKTDNAVQMQANESVKVDEIGRSSTPKNQSVTTSSQGVDNKKIFYAGCIFALLVVIGFFGFQIYEKMNASTASAPQINSNQETSSKVSVNQEASSDKDLTKEKQDKTGTEDKTMKSNDAQTTPKPNTDMPATPPAQPKVSEPPDIAGANGQNQKNAIRALYDFHKNITEHKLQNAYGIFSPAMQGRVSYDGWAPGFNTTVSSTPSDVKVASESDSRIVLTYYLQAVDNPGGTQNFTGTAVMVKVGDTWKIDEVTNKVKK